ncbi:MAG: F0F1 ATP synthase subunit B [Elainellaceae cyanobacterium]
MLIDWFTVAVQVFNFLLLIFLLRLVLYKPITRIMRERQTRIENQLEDAQKQREQAQEEANHYRQKQRELEEQRSSLIAEAKEKANQHYQEMMHDARRDIEQRQARWKEAIEQEQQEFLDQLQRRVIRETYAIARQAFRDLADASLEQQTITVFMQRLKELDDPEWRRLVEVAQSDHQDITIRSSFELSDDTRQSLIALLQDANVANGQAVKFSTSPDLICGIEMQVSDREIAWSFNDYLQALEDEVSAELEQEKRKATAGMTSSSS